MRRVHVVALLGAVVLAAGVGGTLAVSPHLRAVARDAVAPAPDAVSPPAVEPTARRYVDAVAAKDLDALVAVFAPDALIVDVTREIRGHDAIRHWAETEVIGGRLTVLGETPRPGGTTLLVRFQPGGVGGFRASYSFDIAGGLITRAELQYA
ncbi:nuclear transport factor 2 family protein [Nonomuraea indica]|uniref:nuclear transport factor 2 family protein n=1 Tax=Nonomuraea indica TaxID=1581193 RepID=UPI000C7C96F9|nr:nuclear transport factor 2 family protein [Nonomuraea indica]